jgi:hypothetical protein
MRLNVRLHVYCLSFTFCYQILRFSNASYFDYVDLAMPQAMSGRSFIAEVWVQSQDTLCGASGENGGIWNRFLLSFTVVHLATIAPCIHN